MNPTDFKKRLQDREVELLDDIARNQTEVREDTERDSPEPMERAVNLEGAESLLRHNEADYKELDDVRAALERMENGTFGKCLDCGKPIPDARLIAIPWAKYCLEDQQLHDEALGDGPSPTL
jgi:DnaK suppressor protein